LCTSVNTNETKRQQETNTRRLQESVTVMALATKYSE
jgi:hypothetical protein